MISRLIDAHRMAIGIAVRGVIVVAAWRGACSERYFTPVEMSGLDWHFVDIVWVFLLPFFYLIRQRGNT